jgi:hypothetical protein
MVPAMCGFADKVESGGRAAIVENRGRPNLQTRRLICNHAGAKMLTKRAFQKSYLTAY